MAVLLRIVALRRVGMVRMVAVRSVRSVAVEEHAAAGCAHTVRGSGGAFGVGVGGGGGGGLLGCAELSHRAAQPEEEQQEPKAWCGQHDPPFWWVARVRGYRSLAREGALRTSLVRTVITMVISIRKFTRTRGVGLVDAQGEPVSKNGR